MGTNPDALGIPFGKYQLIERLGRGGMAEVWKAKALGPHGYARKLVVKRVLPALLGDEECVRMFVDEARLSAQLNHRNIVDVYEFGEVDGEYYLAMEWLHGRDLNSILCALRDSGAAAPIGLAAFVTREVCRALAYAHALTDDEGTPLCIVHRDVSPSNVMVCFDGGVKLLDFGIAKALARASESRTQAGVLKGKFGYMAPEQVEGEAAIDHRADLFVVGILLWEMLTMRRLFKGANEVQTMRLVRAACVAPPSRHNPSVSPELDAIVLRALARRREERFADCGEMAAALDGVVERERFGDREAARCVRALFPDVREPTQQLSVITPPPTVATPVLIEAELPPREAPATIKTHVSEPTTRGHKPRRPHTTRLLPWAAALVMLVAGLAAGVPTVGAINAGVTIWLAIGVLVGVGLGVGARR